MHQEYRIPRSFDTGRPQLLINFPTGFQDHGESCGGKEELRAPISWTDVLGLSRNEADVGPLKKSTNATLGPPLV